MEPVIHAATIQKIYGNRTVLDGVSLDLFPGEIVGLIGPSGAGKTTLVKIIMGMEAAKAGQVMVLGTLMPNRAIMTKIGYMAQSDALYDNLSAKENLRFFGQLMGVTGSKLDAAIAHVAQVVNLTDDLGKRINNYSGGMKRRLSLAIAMIQDPDVLILDEPTVGIDPELRQQIWAELNSLKDQGKSVLITTHVMDEAERCDRLALIREGVTLAAGSPKALETQYEVDTVEQVFLKAGRLQDAHTSNR
ncbi:glycosyl transferase family 2 [Secundilactobacillus paracollinoides]|uniref:Glycosyl transferase family 2 n=1 Tax=Secundilactobacillus paracollinoides TaxID=240427 RepID=A0A1B2IVS7_9LACO|nr:ABC transporter ATP-binding protein [Secundilactobacillus paracollinoides]ANZ60299.1 glycosyl transferase family 2 [Secundilactobacillus paracollinoides]ANZ62715.1 glycosyl transferase family 2 [Secundilactobacillus paracollinoides]ANZ66129.1 glycosyl transferase family 2 [Secundilactobacillus paracollinoides]KRL75136.1 ABC superfamily ATP binding cassette transporter, ABC protein [Secundilactobacillus paracollinoides DSM 15502 = JCM 11969]